MAHELLEPIFATDPASPYFFHGRLLSADDLRAEQQVQRAGRRRLGRAVGAGVVEGLEVEPQPRIPVEAGVTAVHVRAGLALNAKGQALELARGVDVALVLPDEPAARPGPGLFAVCEPPSSDQLATGTGFYVLAITPAESLSAERAPASGLGVEGRVVGCGSRYLLEGVQLRLVELRFEGVDDVPAELSATPTNAAQRSRRRNLVAHLIFGTGRRADFAVDPFARIPGDAESSALLAPGHLDELSDCDVPLALLEWTENGLADVDLWAVRRRPVPLLPSRRWPTLAGERWLAVAEAVFLQFQAHLEKLLVPGIDVASLRAGSYFRYLPPAGFLPFVQGVTAGTFFAGLGIRRPPPVLRDGRRLEALLRASFAYPPIDVDLAEPVWLHHPNVPLAELEWVAFSASHLDLNQILGALEEHDLRLNALESSDLAITGFLPEEGPYRVGDPLEVLGKNFQFSLGAAVVFLDGVRVTPRPEESTDERLVFTIPPVPGVTQDPTPVKLQVNNQSETVALTILLRAREAVLFGNVDVAWSDVAPEALEAGEAAVFGYTVGSRASAAADFLVHAVIEDVEDPSRWEPLEVLDSDGEVIADSRIELVPLAQGGEELKLLVRLPEVPAGTEGTSFRLSLTVSAGEVEGGDSRVFTVGEETVPADPTISLDPTGSLPPAALQGTTVRASAGATVRVFLSASFQVSGIYAFTVATLEPTAGWAVQRHSSTLPEFEVIVGDAGAATRSLSIEVAPASGASTSGRALVTLQRQGETAVSSRELDLVLIST